MYLGDNKRMENYPYAPASRVHRLGGYAVDVAMSFVTLGIGWFIWSLVVWGQGQTPGKQIVKLRVYDQTTGKPVKWGHMAIRQFGLPTAVYLVFLAVTALLSTGSFSNGATHASALLGLVLIGLGLYDTLSIFKAGNPRRLVDDICKTDVLNEAA